MSYGWCNPRTAVIPSGHILTGTPHETLRRRMSARAPTRPEHRRIAQWVGRCCCYSMLKQSDFGLSERTCI